MSLFPTPCVVSRAFLAKLMLASEYARLAQQASDFTVGGAGLVLLLDELVGEAANLHVAEPVVVQEAPHAQQ